MRNIYQDDFSAENLQNTDTSKESPTQNAAPKKPVRPAKQAPPPIKKSVISGQGPSAPESGAQSAPYGQPGFYPQPFFYQTDANGQALRTDTRKRSTPREALCGYCRRYNRKRRKDSADSGTLFFGQDHIGKQALDTA